jgi:hypothetical protein
MRRFRNGQTRCRILLEGAPKNNFRIAVLMAAGSLQILLGAIGVVAYSAIARSPKAKEQLMTIAAGAGKLLWFLRPKERGYI